MDAKTTSPTVPSVVFYAMAHSVRNANHVNDKKKWREIALENEDGDAWALVRYRLEFMHGMHGSERRRHSNACFVAIWLGVYKENGFDIKARSWIHDASMCNAGARFVVSVRHVAFPLFPFCPRRYDPRFLNKKCREEEHFRDRLMQYESLKSEEARIQAVINEHPLSSLRRVINDDNTAYLIESEDGFRHPSSYQMGTNGPIPPVSYICKGCLARGAHFRECCPRTKEDAVDRRHFATGIPKSFLVSTVPSSNNQDANPSTRLLDESGNAVLDCRASTKHADKEARACRLSKTINVVCGQKNARPLPFANDKQNGRYVGDDPLALQFEDVELSFEAIVEAAETLRDQRVRAFSAKWPQLMKKRDAVCQYYIRGICHKDALTCDYRHSIDSAPMPVCQFYIKNECARGDCPFTHSKPGGLVAQQPCFQYLLGFCPRGPQCGRPHIKREVPPSRKQFLNAARECGDQKNSNWLETFFDYGLFVRHARGLCAKTSNERGRARLGTSC